MKYLFLFLSVIFCLSCRNGKNYNCVECRIGKIRVFEKDKHVIIGVSTLLVNHGRDTLFYPCPYGLDESGSNHFVESFVRSSFNNKVIHFDRRVFSKTIMPVPPHDSVRLVLFSRDFQYTGELSESFLSRLSKMEFCYIIPKGVTLRTDNTIKSVSFRKSNIANIKSGRLYLKMIEKGKPIDY